MYRARPLSKARTLILVSLKEERIDAAWVRKIALNFEKRISKNSELRAKFELTPEKYVQDCYITEWVFV